MSLHDRPWPAGTPCWVELRSHDTATASRFYRALFDWGLEPAAGGADEALVFRVAGRDVAGLTPDTPGPHGWMTYLATWDVEAGLEVLAAHGGKVVDGPADLGDAARTAVAHDPTGTPFGLWQSKNHPGVQLVNEPGGVIWNEHISDDLAVAQAFYCEAFGVCSEPIPDVPVQEYATLTVNDRVVGGLRRTDPEPDGAPPGWLTYFAVLDTDAVVDHAVALGGSIRRPAWDSPFGRLAVLAGPEGESFAVMQVPAEGYDASDQPLTD